MTDRIIALLVLSIALGAPVGLTLLLTSEVLLSFVFFYPLVMSVVWMVGGLYFWWQWERHWTWRPEPGPNLAGEPLVSILIPCFNEEANGEQAIIAALSQDYANLEVIAVNDGSSDQTGAMLDRLTATYPELRVLHLAQNQGKAMALRMGAM